MFEHELNEARESYEEACNHHSRMANLHREGAISDEELMEAIENMRQAQEDLDSVRARCS